MALSGLATKTTLHTLRNKKKKGEPVSLVTCYNYWQAQLVEQSGMDAILVGDSMGMTELGMVTTNPVTMDAMILHTQAVMRGLKNLFVIGDMPYMSYQISNEEAIRNASRFIVEGCDCVKLEGFLPERIRAMSEAGINVMGHLGLTPQSTATFGGYRVQGKTEDAAREIARQAKILEDAGMCSLLLEAMPTEASKIVRDALTIPVYGIGAGDNVDGQLIIFHDIVGLFFDFTPRFVHKYCDAGSLILDALKTYAGDVRTKTFPFPENIYPAAK